MYLHILHLQNRGIPVGDGPSWMSVAAEFSAGRGFTTRWFEHPFLEPWTLPRPDDFRFPGLVVILGTVFRIAGVSHLNALTCVSGLFFLFAGLFYAVIRKLYGRRTALTSLALMLFSLQQLRWNTAVYTEGLFGCVLTLFMAILLFSAPQKLRYWIGCGICCGVLFLVRPNGVFAPVAMIVYFLLYRKKHTLHWRSLLIFCAVTGIIMVPWLLRNTLVFSNPLHIAGSAGLLRTSADEPLTYSLPQFIALHGIFYPMKAVLFGIVSFFRTLDFFEHHLEILPLLLFLAAALSGKRFYTPVAVLFFTIMFAACSYVSFRSWAGNRYYSMFLPYIFAYGLHHGYLLSDRMTAGIPFRHGKYAVFATSIIMLLAPVYFPHRYYLRQLSPPDRTAQRVIAEHLDMMDSLFAPDAVYGAGEMGRVNFMSSFRCVGMQQYYDAFFVKRTIGAFPVQWLVLTEEELENPRFTAIVAAFRDNGKVVRKVVTLNKVSYLAVSSADGISSFSADDRFGEQTDGKDDE